MPQKHPSSFLKPLRHRGTAQTVLCRDTYAHPLCGAGNSKVSSLASSLYPYQQSYNVIREDRRQRAYARKPRGKGLAKRGATAGQPLRHQNDPRTHLSWQDLAATLDSVRFADQQGTPLTAFFTVTWSRIKGFNPHDADAWDCRHGHVTTLMRHYLKRHGIKLTLCYVRERATAHGAHSHFMLHIPGRGMRWLALAKGLRDYLRSYRAFTCPTAVHVNTRRRYGAVGMQSPAKQLGVVQYLGKGIDPNHAVAVPGMGHVPIADLLGIKPQRQASIPGKRVGCSVSIGPTARLSAGYVDSDDIMRLAELLPLK